MTTIVIVSWFFETMMWHNGQTLSVRKISSKMIHIICIVSCYFRTYNVWPFSTTVSKNHDTMNSLFVSRIHYLFGEFTMNLLGFLWFTMDFREITINSVPGPWIHYLLRLYTMNSPSFFATQLWFYFLFHEFASYFAKLQ